MGSRGKSISCTPSHVDYCRFPCTGVAAKGSLGSGDSRQWSIAACVYPFRGWFPPSPRSGMSEGVDGVGVGGGFAVRCVASSGGLNATYCIWPRTASHCAL